MYTKTLMFLKVKLMLIVRVVFFWILFLIIKIIQYAAEKIETSRLVFVLHEKIPYYTH